MNKKTPLIILVFIFLACFFLPLVEWNSWEMTGMNFVLSSQTPDIKYILLLIPGVALLVLLKVVKEKDARFVPFCVAIALFIICYSETPRVEIFRVMDYGYWITLIASVALVFVKPDIGYA